MKAVEGLKALLSARKAFLMVNPELADDGLGGTPYDESQIDGMIHRVETQLILCRQRIQNMKESFKQFTGVSWNDTALIRNIAHEWTREEDEANGTILLTKTGVEA